MDKAALKNRRNGYEYQVLVRLAEILPADVRVRIVADRGFGDHWGAERVEAACQRGIEIGARSYSSITSILRNNLDRAYRPQPVPDEPPVQHSNIRGGRYYH